MWREARTKIAADGETALWVGRGGHRLTARAVDLVVRNVAADAGLELSAHVLRHTCITRLVRGGGDVVLVAEIATRHRPRGHHRRRVRVRVRTAPDPSLRRALPCWRVRGWLSTVATRQAWRLARDREVPAGGFSPGDGVTPGTLPEPADPDVGDPADRAAQHHEHEQRADDIAQPAARSAALDDP